MLGSSWTTLRVDLETVELVLPLSELVLERVTADASAIVVADVLFQDWQVVLATLPVIAVLSCDIIIVQIKLANDPAVIEVAQLLIQSIECCQKLCLVTGLMRVRIVPKSALEVFAPL